MPNILVIDSERKGAERLRGMLEDAGATVVLCLSGDEAMRLMQAQVEAFDAAFVLWDVEGLPSGLELIVRCRDRWAGLPMVVLSNRFTSNIFVQASRLGAKEMLRKPFSAEEVANVWQRLVAKPRVDSQLLGRLRERVRGETRNLLELLREVEQVILNDQVSVLLLGETGTGKGELAKAIHELSTRRNRGEFKKIILNERPASLVEADLFGIKEKTFTGVKHRRGVLEEAGEGTVFLDEIGELSEDLQVKLLKVVETKKFMPLGTTEELDFQARLIFATNKDLLAETGRQKFRLDLLYRIAGATINIPPLRERKSDVPLLLRHFLELYRKEREINFAPITWEILCDYDYPGNVRELMQLVEGGVAKCDGTEIRPHHLNSQTMGMPQNYAQAENSIEWLVTGLADELPGNWAELKREAALQPLVRALTRAFDRVYLPRLRKRHRHLKEAADAAGIDPKTFRTKWIEAGLTLPGNQEENGEE
ncbi:MAG TPA: sigma 54-interacting transcriptional regulator [Blastocatellia bacterium]